MSLSFLVMCISTFTCKCTDGKNSGQETTPCLSDILKVQLPTGNGGFVPNGGRADP